MKTIKRILIVLGALVMVFLFAGLFLPRLVHVERSVVIKAPQEAVFDLVNGFEMFNDWSPWAGRDPEAEYTFAGPKTGVGAVMAWKSDNPEVGSGRQEIIESERPRWVKTAYEFGKRGAAVATFALRAQGEETHITWGFDTDLGGNPVARYFGLVLDDMIGPAYERGLENLAELAESRSPPVELSVEDVGAQKVIYISGEVEHSPANVSKALAERYGKLAAFMKENGIEPAGPPLAITTKSGPGRWAFQAAMPIDADVEVEQTDEVKLGETYGGKVVRAVHKGPYEQLRPAYQQIMAFIEKESLAENGNSWEQYVNDPAETKPEELVTNIYFPVKQ